MQLFNLDEFERRFEEWKENSNGAGADKKIEFWTRMLSQLRNAKRERKGFELGAIELLLKKVADVKGADSLLKEELQSALSSRLSATGREAFMRGELATLVDRVERERFRNPAAHSRYVDLATAKRCKEYVERALEQLIAYTSIPLSGGITVH